MVSCLVDWWGRAPTLGPWGVCFSSSVSYFVSSSFQGLFADKEHGIEGACAPLLIHTNKSKTKAKEQEERLRQRQGETPTVDTVAPRFLEGLDDVPEVSVATTHSGSMTQEVFYQFVKHFIASLSEGHGPVILLLDGHGSRWSVPALQLLLANNVYPFFIASHTSIWAQPNDAGINKRFHWALEQLARSSRRNGAPNVGYFNRIFAGGWKRFLAEERADMVSTGCNNTTNAYRRTGVKPFDPFCSAWGESIETLGHATKDDKTPISYEVVAKLSAEELSEDEKKLLREGLELEDDQTNDLGDHATAMIRGDEILKVWRERVEKGVSEGNEYEEYAAALLPETVVTSEIHKTAMKLICFELVDITKVTTEKKKTKEEKANETTKAIIKGAKISDPIKVAFLSDSDESSSDDASTDSWTTGHALKTSKDGKWLVVSSAGASQEVEEDALMDASRYKIEKALSSRTTEQARKQAQKAKRQRAEDQRDLESSLVEKARKARVTHDYEEYRKMTSKIVAAFKTGGQVSYGYEEFEAMAKRIREPFRAEIEGHVVTVTESDSAVMMKQSALTYITEKVLVSKKRQTDDGNEQGSKNKKQRTSGNAAVSTHFGATGYVAHASSRRRDKRQDEKETKSKVSALRRDLKTVKATLVDVAAWKNKCEQARRKAVLVSQRLLQPLPQPLPQPLRNYEEQNVSLVTPPAPEPGVTRALCEYWEVRENATDAVMSLFLRLFEPPEKVLTKPKQQKWNVIKRRILPVLSPASFDSKVEDFQRRIPVMELSLVELEGEAEDEPTVMNSE